jgi:hypothetical protein
MRNPFKRPTVRRQPTDDDVNRLVQWASSPAARAADALSDRKHGPPPVAIREPRLEQFARLVAQGAETEQRRAKTARVHLDQLQQRARLSESAILNYSRFSRGMEDI